MQFEDIRRRMRNGTGVGSLIYGGSEVTQSHHYIDSLDRFEKDFATSEKKRREEELRRKTAEIEKRRERIVDRQQKYYRVMDQQYNHQVRQREKAISQELQRVRRRANVTSLPYNPINLQYEQSEPGLKLKRQDQDHQIRNYVRSHNIDHRGNSKYNPLTGQWRVGVQKLVPEQLGQRFSTRLGQHYDAYKIKLPEPEYNHRRKNLRTD